MTRQVASYDLTLAPAPADWDAVGSSCKYLGDACHLPVAWAEQTEESVFSSPEETETFGYASAQPNPPQPSLPFNCKPSPPVTL